MRIAVVTAANVDMSGLALDLTRSVRACMPVDFGMFCMDVGLDEANRQALRQSGTDIVAVGWDYPGDFPGEWFKALSGRPHIPRYVPGYDLYIWLDADCWVQDGFAFHQLIEAASKHPLAAVSSIYPGYRQFIGTKPDAPGIPYGQYYQYLYSQLLEPQLGQELLQRPYLNGGVLAARADSPIWPAWQTLLGVLYPKGRRAQAPRWARQSDERVDRLWKGGGRHALFHSEEVALNVVGHLQVGNPAILTARCNWLCAQAIPMVDREGLFVDTTWPHERIGIMHMTALTKEGTWKAKSMDGGWATTSLRMR